MPCLADLAVLCLMVPACLPIDGIRPVKIFAADEGGQHHCVCSFVRPLRSGRLLETPRHAARFVSLIPLERLLTVGGARCEAWQQPLAFVARGRWVRVVGWVAVMPVALPRPH